MNQEDREDFWNGAAQGEHAEKQTAGQKAGSFIKSLLVFFIFYVCLGKFYGYIKSILRH